MKKSMIAAVVAATAFAATANAGWFTIQGASTTGATLTTPTGTYTSGNPSANFNITGLGSIANAGATGVTYGGALGVGTMTQAEADNIVGQLGITGNGTLAYFGFEGSATGPGYFGIAFIGNGATVDFTMANANTASLGVSSSFGGAFGGNTFETAGAGIATTVGVNYVVTFGGTTVGSQMGAGTVSDSGLNVRYLSWNGSSWATVGSANGATSSSLNVATYSVPVPAPALLAGAGLVGAAALRRRMAKKA